MSEFLNLNLGPKNKLTTQPLKDYNKDGAILFTTDTQELLMMVPYPLIMMYPIENR